MCFAAILPLPSWSQKLFSILPGWEPTDVECESRMARPARDSVGIYYTYGLQGVQTEMGYRSLRKSALVLIPKKQTHAWVGPKSGKAGVVGELRIWRPVNRLADVEQKAQSTFRLPVESRNL